MWKEIEAMVGLTGLRIFFAVWFERHKITPEEEAILKPAFEKFPLKTDDFAVWLKQRARQEYEKSFTTSKLAV